MRNLNKRNIKKPTGTTSEDGNDATTRICLALAQVPPGRVVTYGELALLAGYPRAARLVGQTLRKLPQGTRLPWHRVINAQGRISLPEPAAQRQLERLRNEGVTPVNGRVDLAHYGWPKPGEL